jgi:UDP-N-acetylglucosamine--N-acetylmuramyl-(pentapeptide) pyrophosphoryl-undecaprenol N-acetylglucosamine transferase
VRPEVLAVDRSDAGRAAARRELGLPENSLVVAVAGGSLGAKRINEAVVSLASEWSDRSGLAIRHVIGERDFSEYSARVSQLSPEGLVYTQVEFENRMDLLLAAADVAVQRAGASTVAELTVVGLPSILVPLPGAPGDHQTVNARQLEAAGAAVMIADSDLDAKKLALELDRLLGDPDLRARMTKAAHELGRPGAAADVAALAEGNARV